MVSCSFRDKRMRLKTSAYGICNCLQSLGGATVASQETGKTITIPMAWVFIASYLGVREEEGTPGTHYLRMRLIKL